MVMVMMVVAMEIEMVMDGVLVMRMVEIMVC